MATPVAPASEADCTLQISGLAPGVTQVSLLNLFRSYGPILRTTITTYGSAHVVFQHSASAQRAMKATNGAVLEGKRIAVSVARSFKKTSRPCRSFQAGVCRQGDNCKYLHVGNSGDALVQKKPAKPTGIPVVAAAADVAKARDAIRSVPAKKICDYFRRAGQCKNGDACRNVHILNTGIAKAYSDGKVPAPPMPRPRKTPCQFFALGKCERGAECAYSHGEPAPAAAPRAKKPATAAAATAKTVTAAKPVKTAVATAKTVTPAKPVKPVKAVASTAPVDTDASRTCVECEQAGVAQWACSKCDDARYCDACFALVHQSKVMRSHARTRLAPLVLRVANPPCDECEAAESSVQCAQCAVVLCAACDASVHQFKSLRTHVRSVLGSEQAAAPAAASSIAAKRRPVAAVTEPVLKKQKASAATTQAATPGVGAMAYVDSVPKFDLSSDSESSSDAPDPESENESDDATDDAGVVGQMPAVAPVAASTAPMRAVPGIAYVESVPKYELSSDESESDDEDEAPQRAVPMEVDNGSDSDSDDDDGDDTPAVAAAPVATPAKVVGSTIRPVATPIRRDDISSESSDDEDERPIVRAAPVRKVAAPTPVATASSRSSSSESSDDEDEKPRAAVAPPPPAPTGDSDSDSDSSSSDNSVATPAPVTKAALVKKATPPAAVAKRAPPPKTHRGSATPGISTGSSHSLVKKIEAYAASGVAAVLHLDATLNGFERLLAHDCAERLGLQHVSVGEGLERHITIANTR
ncbi:hypothetical protein PybrP1_009785 [[Pythium] brassicae (nom. inval.)]|nr:hypothetical protein PybrP1_009785 [[Pythium] brassicae (nom. inval.)]